MIKRFTISGCVAVNNIHIDPPIEWPIEMMYNYKTIFYKRDLKFIPGNNTLINFEQYLPNRLKLDSL